MKDITVKFLENDEDVYRTKTGNVVLIRRGNDTSLAVRFLPQGEKASIRNGAEYLLFPIIKDEENDLEIIRRHIFYPIKEYDIDAPRQTDLPFIDEEGIICSPKVGGGWWNLKHGKGWYDDGYKERKAVLDNAFGRRR